MITPEADLEMYNLYVAEMHKLMAEQNLTGKVLSYSVWQSWPASYKTRYHNQMIRKNPPRQLR